MAAGCSAAGEARLRDLGLGGKPLQFAILRMLLARAWRRMIRHQQLDQRVANTHQGLGVGLDVHSLFSLTDTGGSVDPRAHVHYAYAADAHGILILLVAESGDGNAERSGRIKNSGPFWDGHGGAVDGQLHVIGRNRLACRCFGTHDY